MKKLFVIFFLNLSILCCEDSNDLKIKSFIKDAIEYKDGIAQYIISSSYYDSLQTKLFIDSIVDSCYTISDTIVYDKTCSNIQQDGRKTSCYLCFSKKCNRKNLAFFFIEEPNGKIYISELWEYIY